MKKLMVLLVALFLGSLLVAPMAQAKDDGCRDRVRGNDCEVVKPPPPPVTPPVVVPVVVPVAAPAAPKGPGPYLQAYGSVEDPTCALTVAWAKWPGVPDGGWHAGWGQWLDGGKGGAACLRTVTLVGKAWVVS
jgi:hypothetical protein